MEKKPANALGTVAAMLGVSASAVASTNKPMFDYEKKIGSSGVRKRRKTRKLKRAARRANRK